MIGLYIIFVVLHFFMSGMLTSAILVNRVESRTNPVKLYVTAVVSFVFGLYFIISLVGYTST